MRIEYKKISIDEIDWIISTHCIFDYICDGDNKIIILQKNESVEEV